ncbi:hypothetical protein PVL29_005202 [Vitis rotundifolia]|uniref:C2 domain-containing protein n=1 Tax=Vitis rotundifolia TaxID=103349 RepID=A0AA39ACE1_VITRO|nr:hypothetical protein PVL29_005202 [Vitis rotundifolia]
MADTPDSEKMVYLYGDLDLKILEARHLPNMDLLALHLSRCFTSCEARKRPSAPEVQRPGDRRHHRTNSITSDPYVKVCVPQATLARTRVISNTQNPYWNERFSIPLAHPLANLKELASGDPISGWFPVIDPLGKPPKPNTALRIEMQFTPCEKNPHYQRGIADDPEHMGVHQSYFPLRRGGSVALYQDAHSPEEAVSPEIELDGGRVYKRGQCWEDICHAIVEAHHLIYLVGWSIFHKVKLIREHTRPLPRGGELSLGELLKYKSEEGVRVLMLVWDDKFSDKLHIFKVRLVKI